MFTFALAPRTPGGTSGQVRVVSTNCFRVTIKKALAFYHYHAIEALPNRREVKNIPRRKEIVKKLYVHDHPNVFQPGQVVYDGKAGLYTSKDLGPDRDLQFELREAEDGANGGLVRVLLQKVGLISSSDFDTVRRPESRTSDSQGETAQQILNLLLHNATPDNFRRVMTRNSMFSMAREDKVSIGLGLQFVKGCFASVRLAREHLLLNVDICSAIMYESNELKDVAASLLGLRNSRQLESPAEIERLFRLLKKVRVKQIKAGKIGRIRTVKEIVAKAGEQQFFLQDGTSMTVQEYFLRVHNYRLQHPYLPGIQVIKKDRYNANTDRKEIIPFELLQVVEGQFYHRKLDPKVHQEVHRLSTVHPELRKRTIGTYLQAFNPAALASAGLYVERSLISVKGRALQPPRISFGNGVTMNPVEGAWRLRKGTPLAQPCTIKCWAVLNYERSCSTDFIAKGLLKALRSNLNSFGINTSELPDQCVIRLENPQVDNKFEHLRSLMAEVGRHEPTAFLLLVILPGGTKTIIYDQIKQLGDTVAGGGVITQCLSWDKVKPLKDQYLSNVILKINVKLGGVNFFPADETLNWVKREPTMIIGLDVSHPGPGICRPSMTALVFSVDDFATKFYALCADQAPRVEVILSLRRMMFTALERFGKRNGVLPSRILVYRDGLSDGELVNVCSEEIQAIKGGITDLWSEAPPQVKRVAAENVKITFVVVGKRHHIRFFPGKEYADRQGNCPSGFVTDDKSITSPHVYDFFIQSHTGLLGTSRPAHYMVIKDDHKLTADQLQRITFDLCHTYARATRAVSIPAPVYYAHLVCRRAGIHIQYLGDELALSTLGSGDNTYNPDQWKFLDINTLHHRLMYYV